MNIVVDLLKDIKKGKLTIITGYHFSQEEADKIKKVLEKKKNDYSKIIDDYYKKVIENKIVQID